MAGADQGTPLRSEVTQGTVQQELLEPEVENGQDYDSSVSWADDLEEMARSWLASRCCDFTGGRKLVATTFSRSLIVGT